MLFPPPFFWNLFTQRWTHWSSTLLIFAFTFGVLKILVLDIFGSVLVDVMFANALWKVSILSLGWDLCYVPTFFFLFLLLESKLNTKSLSQSKRITMAKSLITFLTVCRVAKRLILFAKEKINKNNANTDTLAYWLPRSITFGKTFFEIICMPLFIDHHFCYFDFITCIIDSLFFVFFQIFWRCSNLHLWFCWLRRRVTPKQ